MIRFRGKLGPFVVDAPLTKTPERQGPLSRRETWAILSCLALAAAPFVIVWFL